MIEVKGKSVKKESVEKTEDKREKKKEKVFCRDCEFYNKDSEREFWRKRGPVDAKTGERTMILEIRGICACKTVKAHGHLVKMDNPRECAGYKKGVYKKPEKKETEKQNDEDKTAPHEYHGPPLDIVEESELEKGKKKRLKSGDKVTVTDPTNGETKTFVKKGTKRFVLEK